MLGRPNPGKWATCAKKTWYVQWVELALKENGYWWKT